jgi:hypothetical protein
MTGRAGPLRVVPEGEQPVDGLVAALERWAEPAQDSPEPVARLEVGDGEIRADFSLSAARISELTAFLTEATAGEAGGPGVEPEL